MVTIMLKIGIRKVFTIIVFLIAMSVSIYAQTMTGQQIYKLANRDAEKYVKAGWKPAVKMPAIDRQLNNAYLQAEMIYEGKHQFVMGASTRKGRNYHKVHSEAMFAARKDIINKIESTIKTETHVKIKKDDSNTRQETSHDIISIAKQKLYRTEPVVDIFRELKDGEIEVEVRIAYDMKSNGN